MRKLILFVIVLSFISTACAATNLTIEISTHLGNKDTEISLNYDIKNMPNQDVLTISAIKCDIGHYLHCGRTTGLKKIFILNKTINSPKGSLSFNLNLESWFYNICAELEKTVKGYDCTTNYFILQDNEIIEKEIVRYIEPEKEISISLIEYPTKLKTNQEFEIIANITNNLNYEFNISYYSYVYNGSKLYSIGKWTENQKQATIPGFSTIKTVLKNKIKENINEGIYNLKLRVKFNEKNQDTITQVLITDEKPVINISYISIHKKTFDIGIKNTGNSEGKAILLLNNNNTITKNIKINPKSEEIFRFPINSSEINIYLIKENDIEYKIINLIEPKTQEKEETEEKKDVINYTQNIINDTQYIKTQENKEKAAINETQKTAINSAQDIKIEVISSNFLTGQAVKNEKPFIDYPVLISLIGIIMLIMLIKGVKIGRF